MLLDFIIDAKEERDVTVINIKNHFIQTQIRHEKDIDTIKICRILVDMILETAPYVYGTYVDTDMKGIKQMIT